MKNLLLLSIVALLFTACASGSTESTGSDSTVVSVDTLKCDTVCADSMKVCQDSTKH